MVGLLGRWYGGEGLELGFWMNDGTDGNVDFEGASHFDGVVVVVVI
jgi:hypothetical protein